MLAPILPCRPSSFKVSASAPHCNAIVRAVFKYIPVLVLDAVEVSPENSLRFVTQEELVDRVQSIRVHSVSPELVGCAVRLTVTNTKQADLEVTTKDLEVFDTKGMPLPSVFPPHEFRLADGKVHHRFNVIAVLKPGETVKMRCRIARAVTGASGKYRVAPILALAQVRDNRAAQEAYYAEVPEADRTEESRRNFDACRANAYGVPNEFVLTIGSENAAYTNEQLLVTACHCIVDMLGATVAVLEKKGVAGDVVLKDTDETIGNILTAQLLQSPDVAQATFFKEHIHDPHGILRVTMKSPDKAILHAIVEASDKLKAFYLKTAEGRGQGGLHPKLQAVLTEFKRQSVPEKKQRLVEIGCNKTIVECSDESNLDDLARIYLYETERYATPSLKDMKSAEEDAVAEEKAGAEKKAEPKAEALVSSDENAGESKAAVPEPGEATEAAPERAEAVSEQAEAAPERAEVKAEPAPKKKRAPKKAAK